MRKNIRHFVKQFFFVCRNTRATKTIHWRLEQLIDGDYSQITFLVIYLIGIDT